jgi:hypothetical protein
MFFNFTPFPSKSYFLKKKKQKKKLCENNYIRQRMIVVSVRIVYIDNKILSSFHNISRLRFKGFIYLFIFGNVDCIQY